MIGRGGRVTAAAAARELGISHALASHHLHQLAKYGFVRQVPGTDARERPWELAAAHVDLEGIDAQAGGREAVEVFERLTAERAVAGVVSWHDQRQSWPPGWRRYSGVVRTMVYLTVEELAALMENFERLLVQYVEKRPLDDVSSRPAGSEAVELTLISVPLPPTAVER
jgi:hypothetical protein